MDDALTQLMHTGTVVFGVAVVVITFFIRRLVETSFPSVGKKADENHPDTTYLTTFARYWNQVILYILPPLVGILIGLFDIPYLHGDEGPSTMGGRIFAGIFVGGMSAMVYKTVKKRWGIDLDQTLRNSNV
jgi:hypothetical protein